jgi:hypothetical protein
VRQNSVVSPKESSIELGDSEMRNVEIFKENKTVHPVVDVGARETVNARGCDANRGVESDAASVAL